LADEELAVAQLADHAAGLLTVRIDTAPREHPLFVGAGPAVAAPAELAEDHLRVGLEDEVAAADASACAGFFPVGSVHEVDWIFVIELELVVRKAHCLVSTAQTI
jgi:hypothetical protein